MTVLSNIITPSNVLTTTNTATVTNKTLTSPTVTGMVVSDGTANGVTYLNGSKVLTSGSALTFDGTTLTAGAGGATLRFTGTTGDKRIGQADAIITGGASTDFGIQAGNSILFAAGGTTEIGRFTSTGLGIGTSSPSRKLEVNGYARFTDGTVQTEIVNGGGVGYIGTNNNYPLAIQTNAVERARFDTAGNLGLGVTPSAWNSVFKAIDFSTTASLAGSSGGANLFNNAYYNGTDYIYKTTAAATRYLQSSGEHYWYRAASGTAGNAISFTQAMTLDASGNLGIGTTSPTNRVSIVTASGSDGIVSVKSPTTETAGVVIDGGTSSNKGSVLKFSKNASVLWQMGTDSAIIGSTSDNFHLYGGGANAILFSTNATERARIDSSGNLLVGIGSGSFHRFHKSSSSDFAVQSANTSASVPYGHLITFTAAAPNDATSMFLRCDDTGQTGRIQLRSNGGIANYSANNVNLSDRREKTNFSPATSYLDKICAIPVQTYNYIDQNLEEDDGLTLGVVAQDVQAVAPELVTESNWGTEEEPKMRLSIYQTDLQYALMKCIQELKAEFDAYKASHP